MIVFPHIDPVAVSLGPVKVHWYGLMYLAAFATAYLLSLRRGRMPHLGWSGEQVMDLLNYVMLGIIFGGRLGYVLFYTNGRVFTDPLLLFKIWEGGMSFHGGLLGTITAMWLYARNRGLSFWQVADFVAPVVPPGLFFGRIGNFINAELWGAPTTLPWGMVFPTAPEDGLPRHPSMLYEAFLEGLVLFAILMWLSRKAYPRGRIAGAFLLFYGLFRCLIETVRTPDAQLGYLLGTSWLTMGITLSLPMIAYGGYLVFRRAPIDPPRDATPDAVEPAALPAT